MKIIIGSIHKELPIGHMFQGPLTDEWGRPVEHTRNNVFLVTRRATREEYIDGCLERQGELSSRDRYLLTINTVKFYEVVTD